MKAQICLAAAIIAFVPTAAADDPPPGPAQGTCVLMNDEYRTYPGFDKIIIIETGDATRRGVYDWVPDDKTNPTDPNGFGWTQFTGSCSLLEDIREFVFCKYEDPEAEDCDTPADPNIEYFVLP